MAILGVIGGILFLVGWIWTIVSAFKSGDTLWGVLNIIPCIQPIIGIVSAFLKKVPWAPVGLMILGAILSSIGNYSMMMNLQNQMGR
ncbi:MAG TPA: hypothetical protein VF596_03220 [Pyrinomonadaceae bacterium]|jgi:hypothetical protein